MHELYQTLATGDLKSNPAAAFAKTMDGPVVVMSRSTPKVVMVAPNEWNSTARLIHELREQLNRERRLRIANQRYAARLADPSRGVSQEDLDAMVAEMGLPE
ncbi:MAG: hypothetical protein AAF702_23680 [Chloroflexota bacterium]